MICNEGCDISKHHLDDRATPTSCTASCRHDASRPARLAPRRPTLDVSIGACSRMPRHTLQSLPRLLADPVSCTLYTGCREAHPWPLGRPETTSARWPSALSRSGLLVHMINRLEQPRDRYATTKLHRARARGKRYLYPSTGGEGKGLRQSPHTFLSDAKSWFFARNRE